MQKEVPIELLPGKKIYFSLRKPPLWKSWEKPKHPEILENRIMCPQFSTQYIQYSESDLASFKKYIWFRIDEVKNWTTKDRVLLEYEFIFDLFSNVKLLDEKEVMLINDEIQSGYGKLYFSSRCGCLLFNSLVGDFYPMNESDINPFTFRANSAAILRNSFEEYVTSRYQSINNLKSLSAKFKEAQRVLFALEKVSFWTTGILKTTYDNLEKILNV